MRRSLLALLIAAAACGGTAKPTTPPPTLPDDKPPVEAKTEPEPPAPEAPPAPQPLDVTLPAPTVEVKLVSAGKGRKAPLKFSPTTGTKQTAEIALDFLGGQEAPTAPGGKPEKMEDVAPTAVLTIDAETTAVDAAGLSTFVLTVAGADARDRAGQKVPSDKFKTELQSLIGATISGSVDASGGASDLKVHIDKADMTTVGALQFVQMSLMPLWPALPKEPIGTGAKWTVTTTQKLAPQLEVKKVVTYQLVGKKGSTWTIKGTTKISGEDTQLQSGEAGAKPAQLSDIGGEGVHEVTLTEGMLMPTTKQTARTSFTITGEAAATPQGVQGATVSVKFYIEQGNALTPKS